MPKNRRGRRFSKISIEELLHVGRDEFGHLKHGDFVLAAKEGLQLVVGEDIALVLRILKVVLL
jgi:isopentenyl phosphate kinase